MVILLFAVASTVNSFVMVLMAHEFGKSESKSVSFMNVFYNSGVLLVRLHHNIKGHNSDTTPLQVEGALLSYDPVPKTNVDQSVKGI